MTPAIYAKSARNEKTDLGTWVREHGLDKGLRCFATCQFPTSNPSSMTTTRSSSQTMPSPNTFSNTKDQVGNNFLDFLNYDIIPYAAMSETSSNRWNLSVISDFSFSA